MVVTSDDPVVRRRVAVVTLDTIAEKMAGPAIRAWEIARSLSAEHDVTLMTFGRCTREGAGFATEHVDVSEFRSRVEASEVVVIQGFVFNAFPWLQDCEQVLVVDLYDPFHIETLEVDRYKPATERERAFTFALRELRDQLRRGDFFLCASPRQRDLWLGHLAGAGRLNPDTYDDDPTMGSLLAVAPFGSPHERPVQRRHAIKGVVPGIGEGDRVVIWGGGVYNWFDPLTLVRAVAVLRDRVPEIRLYFLGMRHPNPDVPEMKVAARCRELAAELDLVGTHVFFNEDWVAYEERADYLLDADIGVSCHFLHVETEFSFRTRILDYLWAGLPIVATEGDGFAELIDAEGLGRTVPAEDVDALADALERLLVDPVERDDARAAVERVATSYTWPVVLAPLVEFCRAPRRAADTARWREVGVADGIPEAVAPRRVGRLLADTHSAWRHLRAGGPRQVLAKVRWRLARRS